MPNHTAQLCAAKSLRHPNHPPALHFLDADHKNGNNVWIVSRTSFDEQGRLAFQTDSFKLVGTNPFGSMPVVTNRVDFIAGTKYVYDSLGRQKETVRLENIRINLVLDSSTGLDGTTFEFHTPSVPSEGNWTSKSVTTYRLDGRVDSTETIYPSYSAEIGSKTTYLYDSFGRQNGTVVVGVAPNWPEAPFSLSALNLTTTSIFDDAGRVSQSIDADGNRTWFEYDLLGRQVASVSELVKDPEAISTQRQLVHLRTETEYDDFGRRKLVRSGNTMTSPTDTGTIDRSRAREAKYFYSIDGKLLRVELPSILNDQTPDPLDRIVPAYVYAYDTDGNQVSITDPENRVTSFTYDAEGRQLTRTLPMGTAAGSIERKTYDSFGNLQRLIDSEGRVMEHLYDYSTVGGKSRLAETRYWSSSASQTAQPNAPERLLVFSYDAFGRSKKVEMFEGSLSKQSTTNTFDARGQLISVLTTEAGQPDRVMNYRYYAGSGRLMYSITGNPTRNNDASYFGSSDSKSTTATGYTYDQLGRLYQVFSFERNDIANMSNSPYSGMKSPDGDIVPFAYALDYTSYGYDKNGNLDWERLANGVTIDYRHDDLNRLLAIDHFDEGNNTSRSWDAGERLISRQSYDVDIFGQRTASTDKFYDPNGNLLEQAIFDWSYDELGRLTEELYQPTLGNTHGYRDTFRYSLAGNRVSKLHDDLVDNALDRSFGFRYDPNDRLTQEEIVNSLVPSSPVASTTRYEYGTLGADGSLAAGTTLARVTKFQWTNTSATGIKLQQTEYRYDVASRTAEVKIESFGSSPSVTTTNFTYDHVGTRLSKTESDGLTSKTTLYTVDAANPTGYAQVIEELTTTSGSSGMQVRTSYVIGLDVIAQQSAERTQTAGTWSAWQQQEMLTLLYDGHGSTRALMIGVGSGSPNSSPPIPPAQIATGQLFTYDAYGQMLPRFTGTSEVATSPKTSLLYSGEQTDGSTGLQYLRARYYSPASGRFTQMDPFAGMQTDPQSLHKYLYAHANPVMNADPSGESIYDLALREVYLYSAGLNAALGWYESTVNQNPNSAYLYYANAAIDLAFATMLPPGAGGVAVVGGGQVLLRELVLKHIGAAAFKNLFVFAVANGGAGLAASFLPEGGGRQISQRETSHDVGVQLGKQYLTSSRGLSETDWVNPFELIGKFGQGFDDVLMDVRQGIIYIVEYKGGTSKLVGDQMERPWVVRNIERLLSEVPGFPWGQRLNNALDSGKLRGITIETRYSPSGGAGATKVTREYRY